MATLLAICVVFGVHSFVDWTWFVPGNAVLALLLGIFAAIATTAMGPPPYGRANDHAASRQSDIQPMLISGERKSLPRKRTPAEWSSSEFWG